MDIADEDVRELLGDVIHLIRFPTMSLEEFSQGPARSSVLTHEVPYSSSRRFYFSYLNLENLKIVNSSLNPTD